MKRRGLQLEADLGSTCSRSPVHGSASTIPSTDTVGAGHAAVWQPGERIGRYELKEVIGAGGMGVVWSAHDSALDREVAIKVIRPIAWFAQDRQGALLAEARAMARLSHRNVVAIYDVGLARGSLFVAMERLRGGTLRDWLQGGPRPWDEVVRRFIAAGRGLAEAHRAGLVHRDFKPDNVLTDEQGASRVSDFGLALPLRQALESDAANLVGEPAASQDGGRLGTRGYMAPEQLLGEKLTARSDQFAFCVALYEALYRVKPFVKHEGEAPEASRLAAILEQRIVAPPTASKVPERVRVAVVRGLAFDARHRWPSMDILVAELERCSTRGRRWRPLALALVVAAALPAAWLVRRRDEPSPIATRPETTPAIELQDPGFETIVGTPTDPWLAFGTGAVAHDSAAVHSGQYSRRLETTTEVTQSVAAARFQGRFVRLSGWLKTEGVGQEGARLFIRALDATELGLGEVESDAVVGTTAWARLSVVLPVPSATAHLEVGASLYAPGRAWVDDLEMAEIGVLPVAHRVVAAPARVTLDLSLSADGRSLAYSVGNKVQVLTLATEEIQTIAAPEDSLYVVVVGWYPDGTRLLVRRAREGQPESQWQNGFGELWSVSVAAGPPTMLARTATWAAVSPSGREVAICLPDRVVVSDHEGSVRPVFSSDLRPYRVAWAPDGRHLAILAGDQIGPTALFSVAHDGTGLQVVARRERFGFMGRAGIAWISGNRIVYASSIASGSVLLTRRIDPETGEPETAPASAIALVEGGHVTELTATHDGLKLAMTRRQQRNDIRVVQLDRDHIIKSETVTRGDREEQLLGWAPGGKAVYFVTPAPLRSRVWRHEEPHYNLYRKHIGSSEISFLRRVDRASVLGPDKEYLLELVSQEPGGHRVAPFSSPLGSGESMRVSSSTFLANQDPVVRCSSRCVLARTIDKEIVFHRFDLETGIGQELTRLDSSLRWSPWALNRDATILAMPAKRKLLFVNLLTGKGGTFTPNHACSYANVALGPRDATLYATCFASPRQAQLVRIKTNRDVDVLLTDPSSRFGQLEVSPDGTQIALQAETIESDIWMFEGL